MGRRDVAHDGGVLFCRPRVHLVSGEAFVDGDRSIDVGWDDDESVNLDMNSLKHNTWPRNYADIPECKLLESDADGIGKMEASTFLSNK